MFLTIRELRDLWAVLVLAGAVLLICTAFVPVTAGCAALVRYAFYDGATLRECVRTGILWGGLTLVVPPALLILAYTADLALYGVHRFFTKSSSFPPGCGHKRR